jgi:hypothetical protein
MLDPLDPLEVGRVAEASWAPHAHLDRVRRIMTGIGDEPAPLGTGPAGEGPADVTGPTDPIDPAGPCCP